MSIALQYRFFEACRHIDCWLVREFQVDLLSYLPMKILFQILNFDIVPKDEINTHVEAQIKRLKMLFLPVKASA